MVIGSDEYIAHAKKIREQLNNLAYIAGKLGISSQEIVQQFVEAADIIEVNPKSFLSNF